VAKCTVCVKIVLIKKMYIYYWCMRPRMSTRTWFIAIAAAKTLYELYDSLSVVNRLVGAHWPNRWQWLFLAQHNNSLVMDWTGLSDQVLF